VRRRLLAGAALALLSAGCGLPGDDLGGGGPSSGSPSPSVRATPGALPSPGTLADWQRKGATDVPPALVGSVSLGSVQVMNDTGGSISDADAQRWALAYLRANAYEFWAWNGQQDAFLLRGGLSHVPNQVFGYDLGTIQEARRAGVQLTVTRLQLRRLVLRTVPETLRQPFTTQLFLWTQYAFYLDQVGPSDLVWTDRKGAKTVKAHRDPGVGAPELVGGQLVMDPLMGEIWSAESDWDCTAPAVRSQLGTLCRQ
jgi:hypothetical protein